jgi:aminopeptidase YwaD
MRKQFAPRLFPIVLFALLAPMAVAQAAATSPNSKPQPAPVNPGVAPKVCEGCIRAHEEFLASDAMQGRGSGTHDELVTATYVASELRQYGIEPAGDNGNYIQLVPTIQRKIISPPQLRITPPGGNPSAEPITWDYGKEFLVVVLTQTEFSGPLRKLDADKLSDPGNPTVEPGAVVLIMGSDQSKVRQTAFSVASEGAAATLMLARDSQLTHFVEAGEQLPKLPDRLEEDSADDLQFDDLNFNVLDLNRDAFHALEQMPEGAMVDFEARSSDRKGSTWNAVGILRGSDSSLQHAAILFSAHLDHLGIGTPVNGDSIYNGADDDASGTTAVLEIARVLGRGRRPRRTVIFALFGSEEMGGLGSTYFRQHPPLPLKEIAANLEFEMIGRPDPAVKDDSLWLTGWERSNLGPALAAHGARLVSDPHPGENFFARSDNFVLAKKGVVAQTISSYGLHHDYHQPSDDLAHLDFKHMDAAIGSLLAPVEWLVNSSFRPKWNVGGKP